VLPDSAPLAVAGTLSQQHHDLGALAAAVVTASAGWHAVFIGANTPAEEMAAAALSLKARAVLLSFTYPGAVERMRADLAELRRSLPAEVDIFIGGEAADELEPGLPPAGVTVIRDFPDLRESLRSLSRRA
jgi:methylmalonyl-CoA mutase cobalamin-binding subunit